MRLRWIEDKIDAENLERRLGIRVKNIIVGTLYMGVDEIGETLTRKGIEIEIDKLSKKQLETLDAEFAKRGLHRLTAEELL